MTFASGASFCNSSGRPVRGGNVPKCMGITNFGFSSVQASAASRGDIVYKSLIGSMPIGDLYTMSPREAAYACELLKPKFVIPMHFGTFPPLTGRPEELANLIRDL